VHITQVGVFAGPLSTFRGFFTFMEMANSVPDPEAMTILYICESIQLGTGILSDFSRIPALRCFPPKYIESITSYRYLISAKNSSTGMNNLN
jgi:hypothetical protein